MTSISERIIAYEDGHGDVNFTLQLFSDLVKTGMVWSLQGHYGRTAKYLIDRGYINIHGDVIKSINQ
jgi:hypothetical protein